MEGSAAMQELELNGFKLQAVHLPTEHTHVLLIRSAKGLLGCGYFNVATADKAGDALAIVRGVKTVEDMLNARVVAVSEAAANLGVGVDQTGREALLKMC